MPRRKRRAARVFLVDPDQRVLLLSGIDRTLPDASPVWFGVGGEARADEPIEAAAVREVEEETGLHLREPGMRLATRHVDWEFEGVAYDQDETLFVAKTPSFTLSKAHWTPAEKATIVAHRWWTLDELRGTDEVIYPEGLAALLAEALGAGQQEPGWEPLVRRCLECR